MEMVITMSMMTCSLTALLCIEYVEECVCTEECHFSQCAVQTEPGHW